MDYGTLTETSTIIDEEQVQAKVSQVSLFQKIRNAVSWFITSTLVVHCILVFVQMLYAGFGMIGGTATKSISPFVFAMFRLTLMMVSFNCISFFVDHSYWRKKIDESSIHYGDACCGRNLIPNWSDGLTMGVLGLLVCFNVFSYITAVSLTDYTIVAIIQPTSSIFVCILSVLLKREKGSVLKFIGVLLAVVGSIATLLLITFIGKGGHGGDKKDIQIDLNAVIGTVLEVMNSVSAAFYIVIQKSLLTRGVPPLTINAWSFTTAFPIGLCIGSFFLKDVNFSQIPTLAWIAVLYSGLIIGFVSFGLNAFANKHSSPTTTAVYTTTAPLFATLFKLIFKGETTTPYALFGAAGITIGVILVAIARQRESKQQQAQQEDQKVDNVVGDYGTDIQDQQQQPKDENSALAIN